MPLTMTDPSSYRHLAPSSSPSLAKLTDDPRLLVRTPSPTPSEARELQTGAFDWKKLSNWRFWIRKEWVWYYVALTIILVVTALVTIYHKQIVFWLNAHTQFLHHKLGWLIPIAVLFVISFPPLFGHEIVAILCGLVWGMWIGFAIVAAGTFIGEIGNFYAFRYCCRARGAKLEKNNLTYACLAKVVRDGGFKIALVARLSAIPGHFTTAVFSTCGMGIFVFSLAAILSMPKQFITVYLGVLMEQSVNGPPDTKSRIISDVVLAITILITFLAMWYIYHMMNKAKPEVIYAKRKIRQAKLLRAQTNANASPSLFESSDDIPLTFKVDPESVHRSSVDHEYVPEYTYEAVHAPVPRAYTARRGHDVDIDAELGLGHAGTRTRTSDEDGWEVGRAPMGHAGMGREVAGLGGYAGAGAGYHGGERRDPFESGGRYA